MEPIISIIGGQEITLRSVSVDINFTMEADQQKIVRMNFMIDGRVVMIKYFPDLAQIESVNYFSETDFDLNDFVFNNIDELLSFGFNQKESEYLYNF